MNYFHGYYYYKHLEELIQGLLLKILRNHKCYLQYFGTINSFQRLENRGSKTQRTWNKLLSDRDIKIWKPNRLNPRRRSWNSADETKVGRRNSSRTRVLAGFSTELFLFDVESFLEISVCRHRVNLQPKWYLQINVEVTHSQLPLEDRTDKRFLLALKSVFYYQVSQHFHPYYRTIPHIVSSHTLILRVGGIFTERKNGHSVLIDLFHDKILLTQHESRLHFIDTLVDDLDSFLFCHVISALLVKDGTTKVLSVALCPILDLVECPEIIKVVKRWKPGLAVFARIISTKHNIHLIWSFSQSRCKLSPSKVSLGMRRQFGPFVCKFVQVNILGNISSTGESLCQMLPSSNVNRSRGIKRSNERKDTGKVCDVRCRYTVWRNKESMYTPTTNHSISCFKVLLSNSAFWVLKTLRLNEHCWIWLTR